MKISNVVKGVICLGMITLIPCCGLQSDKISDSDVVRALNVNLDLSEPSYKEYFNRIETFKLESDPQSMLARIDKAICINDSILLLDVSRSNVFLFSPNGEYLNKIGTKGEGPEDYYLCYDFAVQPSSGIISLLNPMGELIDYNKDGRYLDRHKLSGKPNYYAIQWLNPETLVIWSCVNEDEAGLVVSDRRNSDVIYEDWYNDRIIDFRRMDPFFNYDNSVYFAPPMANDVYLVGDTCMDLKYSWKISTLNITKEYIEEIRQIEDSHEKNLRLIHDRRDGTLKDVPIFNSETKDYYYVALETGVGEDSTIKSVFYNKDDDKYVVFTKFKEGMSFRPIYMNDEFVLCQVPYVEVDTYNEEFGLNLKCSEDENPVLARFYFKIGS